MRDWPYGRAGGRHAAGPIHWLESSSAAAPVGETRLDAVGEGGSIPAVPRRRQGAIGQEENCAVDAERR